MPTGSCLCGGVRYEVSRPITEVSLCHCRMCQKAQGSAFAAVAPILRDDFRLLAGEDLLKEYASSPGKFRVFCSQCGSPIYSYRESRPEQRRLRVGTLDTSIAPAKVYHAWVSDEAGWESAGVGAPRYPAFPPA